MEVGSPPGGGPIGRLVVRKWEMVQIKGGPGSGLLHYRVLQMLPSAIYDCGRTLGGALIRIEQTQ